MKWITRQLFDAVCCSVFSEKELSESSAKRAYRRRNGDASPPAAPKPQPPARETRPAAGQTTLRTRADASAEARFPWLAELGAAHAVPGSAR